MALKEVVIVSAARTAIGKFMGSLKDVSARDLAITAAKGAIERSGVPADQIDEICMGQLYTGMQGSLPARQVSMRVGLPHHSSAVSVNQNCTSGMRALEIACHNIMLGQTEIGLAVGVGVAYGAEISGARDWLAGKASKGVDWVKSWF